MKYLCSILLIIFSCASFANSESDELKFCLASLYTAQKAYYYEYKSFSSNLDEIGFNYDMCEIIEEYIFDIIEKDKFKISARINNKVVGSINSNKEIFIY